MTHTLKVAERSDIHIGRVDELLPSLLPDSRVIVITDANIDRRQHSLLKDFEFIMIGTGESIKTLHTVETIYRRFVELGIDRSSFVLGIGGGIVTDITGFVASTYMRGLRFGFISTTLLGQVDASLGGKNGVNLDGYKNMVGTFNQPQFVICDPSLLSTLPEREFRAGMAEIVKAGIIADHSLFERIERYPFEELRTDYDLLGEIILSAIKVKAEIVGRDERESGERRKLNLGHTFAHAIEKLSMEMNHGEAVAVGTSLASRMAVQLGVLKVEDAERIERLLTALGFSLTPPLPIKRLVSAISKDKKADGDTIHFVLPTSIGSCEVRRMSIKEIAKLAEDI
jgi:3-dehydroquinate synthase